MREEEKELQEEEIAGIPAEKVKTNEADKAVDKCVEKLREVGYDSVFLITFNDQQLRKEEGVTKVRFIATDLGLKWILLTIAKRLPGHILRDIIELVADLETKDKNIGHA